MKKILIDVDYVICDSGFLHLLNTYLNTNYSLDDFSSSYMEEDVIKSQKEKFAFYDYIKDKNHYKYATIFDNAKEVLEKLNSKFDLYICSSCAIDISGLKEASGLFFKNKYDFLINNFPFLNINKIIFTGSKNIFNADVQIDDKISHLQNNIPLKLLFTAFHNKNITDEELKKQNIIRVNNWKEIEDILLNKQ